jgi:hypothetical protein
MPATGTTVYSFEDNGRPVHQTRVFVILSFAIALGGCASDPGPPDVPQEIAIPAVEIAGLRVSQATVLDTEAVAAVAADTASLHALLTDAGFETALERRYTGPGGQIRRVEIRLVRFGSVEGAGRYRVWLADHAEDVIGEASPAPALSMPSAAMFVHVPDGCCPKETILALATWQDGRDVVQVLIAGPGADGRPGVRLITALQLRTRTS